jgi:hypothetical protein
MEQGKMGKTLAIAIAVLAVAAIAYAVLTMPDRRTTSEKIGDAIHDIDQGPDKAARDLEDRTPGQKLGDDLKDATKPASDQ